MLHYCRKTLDESVASHVKTAVVMWQITCGLDFLHHQKIQHGNLKLENVLFWKRDSKSKRLVVKLAGYGCKVLIYYLCDKGTIPFTFNNCRMPKAISSNSVACFTLLQLKKKPSQMNPSLLTVLLKSMITSEPSPWI
jgi:serine/threonine protein kinase